MILCAVSCGSKSMSKLQTGICSSMTASVLQKLKSAGVVTVVDFVSHDLDVLSTKSGVGYRELAAIRRVLITEHAAPVVSGSSLFDIVVATTSIVSVGCRALDNLLEGGILTGEITEAVTDRSCVSDSLVLNTIATVVTVTNKNVVFVDMSNHFDAIRLAATLKSRPNVDVGSALKRVRVVRCFDMLELLGKLSMLYEARGPSNDTFYSSLKLIVIDGIVDYILPSLSRLQSNSGCGYVAQLVHQLRLLTTDFCYAVLLFNGDGHSVMSKNNTKLTPIGRLWHSVPDTRLDVTDITAESNDHRGTDKSTASERIKVTLNKSSRLPLGQCVELEINEHGMFT